MIDLAFLKTDDHHWKILMQLRNFIIKPAKALFGLQLVAALLCVSPVSADWDEAKAAADRGEFKAAFEEFRTLAESGHVSAQSTVGVMYYNGEGVEQDLNAALVWLNLAANQGYSVAQFNLGIMYDNGDGVEQDFAEAFKWYHRAAVQGHTAAQFNLGAMYSNGEGVEQDKSRAHMWFNIAALNGNKSAAQNRDQLASTMSPEQVSMAVKMVGQCVNSTYSDC
jgi:hypothetical protein